jgi:hypothetical protein
MDATDPTTTSTTTATTSTTANWYDSLPAVLSSPEAWSREKLADLFLNRSQDFIVVDVRLNDYGVSCHSFIHSFMID